MIAIRWKPAIWAGIVAGVVSTLAQIVLWASFTDAFPSALFRDARLAAAILMGQDVLPPPASFDLSIMVIAACVHFALSIVYAVMLALMIARAVMGISVMIGAGFGAVLYLVNLYGFTAIFPWFAEVRDWITLAAHVVFGVSAAATYRALAR
ncbi:MAG TPA: sodium:proline symporter [Burkholderiales bacterium]|nr:sodium:proline symporter [Burkholderiales bacterium]